MQFFKSAREDRGAAERAADAASKLDAIMRSQAVIEFQLDGTIITANQNFFNAMGYTAAEIEGRHHSMFVDPTEAVGADYKEFWRELNRGVFAAKKFRRIAKGGREIWLQASYNQIGRAHV